MCNVFHWVLVFWNVSTQHIFSVCHRHQMRETSVILEVYMKIWIEYKNNARKKKIKKEIMTRLLKIVHRPCYEQFHVGTIFSLPNYILQTRDGNSMLLGRDATVASSVCAASSGVRDPCSVALPQIFFLFFIPIMEVFEALRTEDVVHGTDC